MLAISVPLGGRHLWIEKVPSSGNHRAAWANMRFSNHARERQCPKIRGKDQEELRRRQKEGAGAEGRAPERDPAVTAGRALPQGTQSGFGKM